jgi:hypothetical protein
LPEDATRLDAWASASRPVAWVAIAAAAVGVFLTWTTDRAVRLDGIQGPNNGWLVLIVVAFALGWARSMNRGSRVGVVGVLGAAIVIAWTAVENWLDSRAVFGASASFGLLLVLAGSLALGAAALTRGLELAQRSRASF